MTSVVSICNLALVRVGHTPITALNEEGKGALACNANYEPCRDATLRAHPWNFAIRRVSLAQLSTTPAYEFAYEYQLPTDFLKIIRTQDEAASVWSEYRIEEGKLRTNAGTVKIEYIAKITDPNKFDPLFVDVLATRIAAEISTWLTDTSTSTQRLWEVYDAKLREARGVDAQEGTPRDIIADEWLVARL
jgi:hypothetical protein